MRLMNILRKGAHTHRLVITLGVIGCGLLSLAAIVQSQQPPATGATQPDYRIRLAGYAFDPLGTLPTIPDQLTPNQTQPGPAYYIIQFTRSLTRAERARLQEIYKLRLTEYIPNFAYLERLSAQT